MHDRPAQESPTAHVAQPVWWGLLGTLAVVALAVREESVILLPGSIRRSKP